ncbi:MAG: enoyl-CoA hydratase/isomerase family protein [Chloroflexi bacterium]|nr:enoyl-CoA hydratase/isomerase family protein [Chloroflexota bacterium]
MVSSTDGPVGLVRLDRPKALNALATPVIAELVDAVERHQADPAVRAIVITGGPKVFAAGADLKEFSTASAVDMLSSDRIGYWDRLKNVWKPLIAAVSGFALGGGCELAMSCDIIIASETARFGQPEINVGLIPGAGGTARLTRIVGKFVAMDLVLTGRQITAEEALKLGLVSRIVPAELIVESAVALGKELAQKPPISLRFAKEAVQRSFEGRVDDGIAFERKLFYMLFATEDAHEGMRAFIEKRRPTYAGQ